MLIPLRTNRPPRRHPIVTEGLVLANLLVYFAGLAAEYGGLFDRQAMLDAGQLSRHGFRAYQLITYQFLHDPSSVWHLAANMLFLWVFGTAVEDRFTRLGYLSFVLAGGAVAGAAHMASSAAPVIGASGAVAGVTGAFLALYPRSQVLVLIFFIGIVSIPALWFIGIYFALDVLRAITGGGRVAYAAHLAGYLYGFALAFALLGLRVIPRGEYDIFFLFRQWRRRAAHRAATRASVGGAFESASADTGRQLERRRRSAERRGAAPDNDHAVRQRGEIRARAEAHDLPAAARLYADLLAQAPSVLSEPLQLDVANQLQTEGAFAQAAQAYELFLEHYPTAGAAVEVRLLLALLYLRRLEQPDRARPLLDECLKRLPDGEQKGLAERLRAEVDA